MLAWSASLDRDALTTDGYDVVEFSALRREIAAGIRQAGRRRTSLVNPADTWLARVDRAAGLAVMGVRLRDLADVRALHGYVLEPALRSRTPVAIESPERLTQLGPDDFVDPQFEYPYTLERALDAAMRLYRGTAPAGHESALPESRQRERAPALDPEQRRAAQAPDGVVQVIAPAGSGKTAVLIERVRELLHRGVPAERILCTTFNRDARVELLQRLRAAGVSSVAASTFHSLGWRLMREEGLARPGGPRELSFNQWRRLCTVALREEGSWIDPADARSAISQIKLALLASPREFRPEAAGRADGHVLARIYELYERQLSDQGIHDFDDLVLIAVRALREDGELRQRWQCRFRQVLVDEYQDVEPAQELLVRILAAPQDGFFCVGDEDQTLYGWRRASVRRIIDLDLAYPGLDRVCLSHNYRCPEAVVDASRRLIEHNAVRFPKPIRAARASAPGGEQALQLREHAGQSQAAEEIAARLADRQRDQVVVLARTTNLLRAVALACALVGVRISAPQQVFEPHGAQGALEAYLRLCGAPAKALPDDVAAVCRAPSRGLPFGAEERVARSLNDGLGFAASLTAVAAEGRQRSRLEEAGRIIDALAAITDAPRFIAYLRGPGGLDEYYRAREKAFGDTERIDLEVLEQAQREAAGKSVSEYAELLQARSDTLRAIRDDVHGIELTTIHRAKGREWPEVHLFGCEEDQLPHRRALDVSQEERAAGEGLEAERRLAYVAFTRARELLVLHTVETAASRFLTEAGLEPSRPYGSGAAKAAPAGRMSTGRPRPAPPRLPRQVGKGPVSDVLREAFRVGLEYALRTSPTRTVAIEAAAGAVEHGLLGRDTASGRTTFIDLLAAIELLSESERASVLQAAGLEARDLRRPIAQVGASARKRFVRALRRQASAG
jgi:DNA helicase-2/ATP-dependent DNA helicase PcrA